MIFPQRLKELREKSGLSQSALADKVGVAQTTIAGWELGKREPNIDTVIWLSEFFDVTIDYLLGCVEEKNGHRIKKPAELADLEVEQVVKTGSGSLTPQEVEAVRVMLNNHLEKLRKEDSQK